MKPSQLLSKRGAWCQGPYAKDKNGKEVHVSDPAACSWCLYGALDKCYGSQSEEYVEARTKILKVIAPRLIAEFNEAPSRTKRQVIAALKKAGL